MSLSYKAFIPPFLFHFTYKITGLMWCRACNSLSRQSDLIRGLFHVQIAFRNLTAVTQESTAKFFTAISVCNYRSDLKLTQNFSCMKGRRWIRNLPWIRLWICSFHLTAAKINQSTDSYPTCVFLLLSHKHCVPLISVSIIIIPLLSTFNGIICHLVKYLLLFG